ncbi:hypothetical protein [Burkholderia pyrrocinia]|uniref:Uncharacterized protein n=1 Tax=Burkholderia pyrrocinia TaxID=60550 RepID=A0ABZ3BNN7_BURPY
MTITEATVWELRLNDVPAAEVREHVGRRIERELEEDRQWDLKIASILSNEVNRMDSLLTEGTAKNCG